MKLSPLHCYIVNTANFNGLDIPKELTLKALEDIAQNQAAFKPFGKLTNMEYIAYDGYPVDFNDAEYVTKLKTRFEIRRDWVKNYEAQHTGEKLPAEILTSLDNLINALN